MEISDIRYVKISNNASIINPDQVVTEVLKARNVLHAPTTPFQRMLERMMHEKIQESRDTHDPTPDPSLLSVNPHMNIKAVMAAHPEQDVFYADGAIKVQQSAAQLLPAHPLQPVKSLQNIHTEQSGLILEHQASFRQIVAPTAIAAFAMGAGVRARAEVRHPDHLSHLFKRTAATPVGKVNWAYQVRNDHTFWDK